FLAIPARAAEDDPKLPPDRDPSQEILQRRPGTGTTLHYFPPPVDPQQVPAPTPSMRREILPVADRWRIMRALGVNSPWYDPYTPNVLKADLPISGESWFTERFPDLAKKLAPDWFLNLGLVSDTLVEFRRLPTPVGAQSSDRPGSVNVFGQGK